MKTKYKNRILRFLIIYCVFLPLCVLPLHFFSSKGMGPQSWEQLWDDKWTFIVGTFFFALYYTIIDDDEEPFWEKLKKRKKKKLENDKDT